MGEKGRASELVKLSFLRSSKAGVREKSEESEGGGKNKTLVIWSFGDDVIALIKLHPLSLHPSI